ncbi:hypothetical protein ACFTSD_17550 [Nocardiaceae bacterium NPDC056970]
MTITAHHIATLGVDQAVALGALSASAGRSLHDARGYLYTDTARMLGLTH